MCRWDFKDVGILLFVVQSLCRVWLFVTPWTAALEAPLSSTISWSLLTFLSTESVMLSNHLILCHPLLLLPSVFPKMGSFPMGWLFASRGLSIEASASVSVLPVNIQGWFPLELTGLISLLSKGLSRVFSNITVLKHQFSVLSFVYSPSLTSIHDYWRNHSFD